MNFLTHLNLNNNELQNVTVQNLATAPGSPKPGQMYFSTANNTLQVWDGKKWLAGGTAEIPALIIGNVSGLQAALDSKAGKSETTLALGLKESIEGSESKIATALASAKTYTNEKVKTNVPEDAVFTDTVYSHPGSHPASMITESAAKRFVSDIEKTKWNGKWDYDEEVIKAVKVDAAINADTVGGLTVKTAVPAGAKFTDTVPTLATLKLDKVDNTSDLNKPVSTATAAALALKADTTALSTSLANTLSEAKTHAEGLIADLIDGAPESLDTLKELAEALANDASYSSTILSKLALKPDKKVEAVGNGTKTSYVITHGFETRDVAVTIRQTGAPFAAVFTDVEMTTENTVTIKFAKAPANNEYTVTIIG